MRPLAGDQNSQGGSTAAFIDSLSSFSRLHRAQHWEGTFGDFLDQILPGNPAALARSSHEYIWDMLRWHGRAPRPRPPRTQRAARAVQARAVRHRRAAGARGRLLQGRRGRLRRRPPPAAAARAALRRQVDAWRSCSSAGSRNTAAPMRARCMRSRARRMHENPLNLIPASLRARIPRDATASTSAASCRPWARDCVEREFEGDFLRVPVERVFLSEASRVGIGTYAPHDPTTADIADLVGSVDLSKVAADRRRRRSARLVVVRRRVRRQPRHARDDRDPQGQARVPLPAADADAGEERQGVALPADPPRRDDPRAHQPRRVPQVPAGEGERGAARPHGHHQGALHALLPRRGAHLPEAGVRAHRRSATCTSIRTC